MNIRYATNEDIPKITDLLRQVNNLHSELRSDLFIMDKTKYSEDELKDIIENDNSPVFVADDNGVVGYGFCMMEYKEKHNNSPAVKTLYIDDICIDEKYRGMNIGKAIYEYIEDFAKKEKCHNITLNVWEGNERAKRFYEKCNLKVQKTTLEKIL